ncbi:hypothetical protein D187_000454 [Cystobacter fuscus DSM 2262]|uniref:Uncharacterized protein n=1 Tax=Cystobacter fuscus (strain ATCC 25194 / DSM 2262 / NBRC 100088 / M29) TaxID=1242864 RepID=S9QUN3_CYSF2|nr:hypothetical protein [Cystobacter fuscus]EPX65029.1 hypothetical protein D187_000454 [Cystobacter fuscus DSM 2262]
MPMLPLVLLLTLTAGDDRSIPPGCREDHGTCREDCTIDYGGSTTKYQQLNQCVARCTRERDACTTRFYTLRDTAGDLPASPTGPAPASERFEEPSKPTSLQDTERRGVYRANEAAPPAEPSAESAPEEMPAAPPPPAPAEPEVESKVELEEKPLPAPKPPAEVKKSPPPRGKREEIRIFGDSDDTAAEASKEDAAPPAKSKPGKPAATPKKDASKRSSGDDWWKD